MSTVDLIIEEQDYVKANSCNFSLSTRDWQSYKLRNSFNWKTYPFQRDQIKYIPHDPGIYSFVIQPGVASYPSCSYLMYIGQARRRTLRKRFSDYLYEQNNPAGRPNILRLLNKYKGYLHFCYSVIQEKERLKEIEDALLDALSPPCNDQYPAEAISGRGAF